MKTSVTLCVVIGILAVVSASNPKTRLTLGDCEYSVEKSDCEDGIKSLHAELVEGPDSCRQSMNKQRRCDDRGGASVGRGHYRRPKKPMSSQVRKYERPAAKGEHSSYLRKDKTNRRNSRPKSFGRMPRRGGPRRHRGKLFTIGDCVYNAVNANPSCIGGEKRYELELKDGPDACDPISSKIQRCRSLGVSKTSRKHKDARKQRSSKHDDGQTPEESNDEEMTEEEAALLLD